MLILAGLHEKHVVQRGPTRHLYLDLRKPWVSLLIAGPSGCTLSTPVCKP